MRSYVCTGDIPQRVCTRIPEHIALKLYKRPRLLKLILLKILLCVPIFRGLSFQIPQSDVGLRGTLTMRAYGVSVHQQLSMG